MEEEHLGLKRKRGRGANQAKILVMACFTHETSKKAGRERKKLQKVIKEQIDDYKSETIETSMTRRIK